MKLQLERTFFGSRCAKGDLYVNGKFFCYTLEDRYREIEGEDVSKWKVPGKTAIPQGDYKIIFNFSERFQTIMPLLENVPGFDGIRIHPGNTEADTSGCILVGKFFYNEKQLMTVSKAAFKELITVMSNAKDEIWISITNGKNSQMANTN